MPDVDDDLRALGRQWRGSQPDAPVDVPAAVARERRARRVRTSAVVVALAIVVGVVVVSITRSHTTSTIRIENPSPTTLHGPTAVEPVRPGALAVGPNHDLYVADLERHQVLERHADGTFVVVAGNGIAGFSGDGGRALDASLSQPFAIAFGADGTMYIADEGDHRIRAVTPNGVITTVAGNGQTGWVADGTLAIRAPIDPVDLKFGGPEHLLYVATGSQILRLEPDDTFTRVAGNEGPSRDGISGIGGPAVDASTDDANALAFDGHGNLFLAGFATKQLLMVTASGRMTLPFGDTSFYPRGSSGLATAPDGSVVVMTESEVIRLTATSQHTVFSFFSAGALRFHGIHAFSPNGIAVGPDGTIFVDTYYGNGYTDTSAIAAINASGTTSSILWRAPKGS